MRRSVSSHLFQRKPPTGIVVIAESVFVLLHLVKNLRELA